MASMPENATQNTFNYFSKRLAHILITQPHNIYILTFLWLCNHIIHACKDVCMTSCGDGTVGSVSTGSQVTVDLSLINGSMYKCQLVVAGGTTVDSDALTLRRYWLMLH